MMSMTTRPDRLDGDERTARRQRGRPRQFDRARVLDGIVDALLAGGLEGVTMNELSRGAGINRPSLRLAFGDRESIVRAAVEHYGCAIRAALRELSRESLGEAIRAMLRRLVMIYSAAPPAASGCLLLALMPAAHHRHPAVSAAIASVRLEISQAITRRIRAATSEVAAATLTKVCVGMILWLAVEARAGAPLETLNEAADVFAHLIDRCSRSGKCPTSFPAEADSCW